MSALPVSLTAATTALQNRATPLPRATGDAAEARKAAEEFEAFFISQVLDNMFKGIKTDGAFGGGHGEKMYRGLMLQEYGKVISGNGGLGLADAVTREILARQEVLDNVR